MVNFVFDSSANAMVLLNQFQFWNLIAWASLTGAAHATTVDGSNYQRCVPKNYCENSGLYKQCGPNLRITKLTEPFLVGEGPFWSTRYKSLLLVDGARSTVCRYAVHSGELFCAQLGNKSVQFIIPFRGMFHKYLTSYGSYLTSVTWDATSPNLTFQSLRQPDPNPAHFVNEAKADSSGTLFFMINPIVPPSGLAGVPLKESGLNNINCELEELVDDLSFGNGIEFRRAGLRNFGNHDESAVYYSDSVTNRTFKGTYNRHTNSIYYQCVLIDYTEQGIPCFPDSMTVDTEGYIWTTCNRYSRVFKVDPNTGNIVCSIKFPAVAPTNVAFGECRGKKNNVLNCLYVTSESIRLDSPTPKDGCLYVVENTGSEGYPPNEVDPDSLTKNQRRMKRGRRHRHAPFART